VTEEERKNLQTIFKKRSLKRQLIDKSGFTRSNVNYVLDGRHENEKIIDTAYKILEDEGKRRKARVTKTKHT